MEIKKALNLFLLLLFPIFLSQCINFGHPQGLGPSGFFYASYTLGVSERKLTGNQMKKGKACVERIVFFYAKGNASIQAAANQGKIQEIFRIEKEANNYFSLYSELCTIVWGE